MLPLNITPAWFQPLGSNQDPVVQGHVGYHYLRLESWHARQGSNLLAAGLESAPTPRLGRLVGQAGVGPTTSKI